ncbi:MAG: NAD-dependent succinate-semialdehyde dehydrogenase [bacterium]|nr:NAD-dependent succinate-semialdehyde dehydrogenase [bacterium]
MTFTSTNPYTGEFLASYAGHTQAETHTILDTAAHTQQLWGLSTMAERADVLRSIAAILTARAPELAVRITQEMGKPIVQARAEIVKCATVCNFMADNAEAILAPQLVKTEFESAYVYFDPLGTVLSIMPWNFPYWQFFRFAAPALMAGNAVLLKHAPTTWGCAFDIVEVCLAGGLPKGLVQCLLLDVPDIEAVIADPRVHAVTFTGSTRGGASVGALAGKYIKKSVLELGGSDAYVILEDADIDAAARDCATSRCVNSGQSCIAAKRFIVHADVARDFTDLLTKYMNERVVGDPMLEEAEIGPLARVDLQQTLLDQIRRALSEGSRGVRAHRGTPVVHGRSENRTGPLAASQPLVIEGVGPGNAAFDEELFGPVAAVTTFTTDSEAIRLANHSIYGLGSAVFTKDMVRAERFERELQAGMVFVNTFVRSDPRLPFGGVKQSGYGRELGTYGIREFVNVKTVVRA